MRIRYYRQVMPVIWGMMVAAARAAKPDDKHPDLHSLGDDDNKNIRKKAQNRYDQIWRSCEDNR